MARQTNRATVLGELRGVVKQIGDHLDEPRGIDVQHAELLWKLDGELDVLCRDGGAVGVDGAVHEAVERRRLPLELNLSRRDPRDIQQVVDQADHVANLTIHHASDPFDRCRRVTRNPDQLQARSNRCQRIAKLMRQHRQELVLAPVGLAQFFFAGAQHLLGTLALGDIARRAEPFDDIPTLIQERNRPGGCPSDRAIRTDDAMFQLEHALRTNGFGNGRLHQRLVAVRNIGLEPRRSRSRCVDQKALAMEQMHLLPIGAHLVQDVGSTR